MKTGKIHKLAASLFKPRGSKRGKKVAAYSPEITVIIEFSILHMVVFVYCYCVHCWILICVLCLCLSLKVFFT